MKHTGFAQQSFICRHLASYIKNCINMKTTKLCIKKVNDSIKKKYAVMGISKKTRKPVMLPV